jgi:hypothetical protein
MRQGGVPRLLDATGPELHEDSSTARWSGSLLPAATRSCSLSVSSWSPVHRCVSIERRAGRLSASARLAHGWFTSLAPGWAAATLSRRLLPEVAGRYS